MIPLLLKIGATLVPAITAGEAAVMGAGLGAIGTKFLMKKRNKNEPDGLDDDELAELVELIVRIQRNKAGKKPGNDRTDALLARLAG